MIDVTDIKFNEARLEKGLLGFASCVINKAIYIGNIAIFSRLDGNGYRLVFPIRKSSKGNKFKIVFPVNNDAYNCILKAITKVIESQEL